MTLDPFTWSNVLIVFGSAMLGSIGASWVRVNYRAHQDKKREQPTPYIVRRAVFDPDTSELLGYVEQWSDTGAVVRMESITQKKNSDSEDQS